MKLGDLVELSAYGQKISENYRFCNKIGFVKEIKDWHYKSGKLVFIVIWFGVSKDKMRPGQHPRRDIKYLTTKKK